MLPLSFTSLIHEIAVLIQPAARCIANGLLSFNEYWPGPRVGRADWPNNIYSIAHINVTRDTAAGL